jgi:glycosyltransferase involved in cell wall biosynthesis
MVFHQSPEWVQQVDSIYTQHGQNMCAPLSPWREALALFRKRSTYDVIHTMGIRESTVYGLLCALTRSPSRQIMAEIFLDEPQAGTGWRVKTALQRLVARRSLGIITNSAAEIPALAERLNISSERCIFVPLNSTLEPAKEPTPGEGFILAAGRSLRDYPLLIEAAKQIDVPITIIGGSDDLQNARLPENVTLLREVSREEYLDYVRRCQIMVLPLQQTTRPTGQVVMLEAMAFGKPVIATEQVGTVDYIHHGKTGFLVPPGNGAVLAETANRLIADRNAMTKIGMAALQTIRNEHTNRIHTQRRLNAIQKLQTRNCPNTR